MDKAVNSRKDWETLIIRPFCWGIGRGGTFHGGAQICRGNSPWQLGHCFAQSMWRMGHLASMLIWHSASPRVMLAISASSFIFDIALLVLHFLFSTCGNALYVHN